MSLSVFDENVLVVANGKSEQADAECRMRAIESLLDARDGLTVLFSYDFMTKYATHCSHAGQPGVGDAFFVWLRDNAATLPQVALEWTADGSPVAFPADPALATFDFDDRIWVAAVCAHDGDSHVVNCVDSDYSQHAAGLAAAGVGVRELCPECLKKV